MSEIDELTGYLLKKDKKIEELEIKNMELADECDRLIIENKSVTNSNDTIFQMLGATPQYTAEEKVTLINYAASVCRRNTVRKRLHDGYNEPVLTNDGITNNRLELEDEVGKFGSTGRTNCPVCIMYGRGDRKGHPYKIRLKDMGVRGNFVFFSCSGREEVHCSNEKEKRDTSIKLICPHCGRTNNSQTIQKNGRGWVTNTLYDVMNLTVSGDVKIHSMDTFELERVFGKDAVLLTCRNCGHQRLERIHNKAYERR